MNSAVTFGPLLRQRRTALNLTQAALAERVGCSHDVLRKFESQTKRPSRQLAERLATELGLAGIEREAFVQAGRNIVVPAPEVSTVHIERVAPQVVQASGQRPQRAERLWLARTKLYPPRVRTDILARPGLQHAFHRALTDARLVLISAPAGTGKTTLVTTAVAAAFSNPVAWLTLDSDDNELVRFLQALVAAFSQVVPSCGTVAEQLFAAESRLVEHDAQALGRHVMTALINELLAVDIQQTVLVLDDLHTVTEYGVHAALDYLLERLPSQLTVVVATRHDPPLALARLRARRELVEFRLPDLRFTVDEAAMLLNQHLGLQLDADEIVLLHRRTEGWATGLSLLAASLEHISNSEEQRHFLNQLARTERYIFEYLAEEVLNREDPFVRMFLLETAILPELTPVICQALTGRTDANLILDTLYRRNLFLLAQEMPDTGRTYRYHDLFREFLCDRLRREAPEWLRQLHHRAGLAETSPVRALQHYLAAEHWQDAVTTIKSIAGQFLDEGAFGTVRSWLTALPEITRADDPWLTYWAGICAWEFFELNHAQRLFERALDSFTATGDALGRGEALLQLVIATSACGPADETRRLAEQARACPLPVHRRARLLLAHAHALTLSGHWQAANDALDQALQLAEQASDPRVIFAVANGFRGSLGTLPGGVQRCERLLYLLKPWVDQPPTLHTVDVLKLTAFAHTWRGRWDAAIAACISLHEHNEQAGVAAWSSATFGAILPLCLSIRGETDAAERYFATLFHHLEQPSPEGYTYRYVIITHLYWYARMHWLHGNTQAVRDAHARVAALVDAAPSQAVVVIEVLLRGLILHAEARFEEAEQVLRQGAVIQDKLRFTSSFSNAHLLLAYLYLCTNRQDEALAQFIPVLMACEHEDVPGFLMWEGKRVMVPLLQLALARGVNVRFARRVLELLDEAIPAELSPDLRGLAALPVPGNRIPLTGREVEVLRLLASGASNTVIAEQLVISPHTAKRHVAHVYAKLNVSSRAEATLRARDLGLI